MKMVFVLVLLGLAWSCKKTGDPVSNTEVTPPAEQIIVSKNITSGSFTEVSNTTIGLSGATVKIAKPGTPIDGVEIAIPANSFSSSPSLKVSYAEIKSHQFGANFNPISPIISISCDGGYSNGLISLTIPVKVPAGHIPLGFYLDETTGKLEGIPVNSYTATSITLLTRHFLPANKLKSGDINLKSTLATGANIVISSIAESALNLPSMITSGFKPGVDDWEFVNDGSYIAPGGHCAGQNMTAMWYYFEKKPTQGGLFNKFSDNSKLWEDNARGYRFCSVIHNDLDWVGKVATLFDKYIDKNQELDKLKLLTIAGTMLVTGEPQGIGIYRLNGLVKSDGTPAYGGHDLICYQVSVSGGKLYISDPNTPGIGQSIDFANNKFKPYIAKLNGHDSPNSYPFVTFYAKTAYIEWDKIGKRWGELVNNTVGTIAPNTFPAYTIMVKDNMNDFELKDGMTVTKDTLRTYVECPTSIEAVTKNGKRIISSEVYGNDGIIKSIQNVPGVTNWGLSTGLYVKLTPGPNKLGYSIVGWNSKFLYNNSTERIPLFIDFKWITVNFVSLKITPDQSKGVTANEGKFIANTNGTAPKSAKYVWNFGDGTATVTKTNDSTTVHTYTKEGTYIIKVELFDNSTSTKISETSISYEVVNLLNILHNCKYVSISFSGDNYNTDGYPHYCVMSYAVIDYNISFLSDYWTKDIPLVWNGNICTITGSVQSKPGELIQYSITVQFKVTLSPDGKTVLDFSTQTSKIWSFGSESSVFSNALVGKNIPIESFELASGSNANSYVSYSIKGIGVQSLLSKISESNVKKSSSKITGDNTYATTLWNSNKIIPEISIFFQTK